MIYDLQLKTTFNLKTNKPAPENQSRFTNEEQSLSKSSLEHSFNETLTDDKKIFQAKLVKLSYKLCFIILMVRYKCLIIFSHKESLE